MKHCSYILISLVIALICGVSCKSSKNFHANHVNVSNDNISRQIQSEYRAMLDVVSTLDSFPNNFFELHKLQRVVITPQLAQSMLTSIQNNWDLYGEDLQYQVYCIAMINGNKYMVYSTTDGYFEKIYVALDPQPGMVPYKLLIFDTGSEMETPTIWFDVTNTMLNIHSLHKLTELWILTDSSYDLKKGIDCVDSHATCYDEDEHIEQKHAMEWEKQVNDFFSGSFKKKEWDIRLDEAFKGDKIRKVYYKGKKL